jgi:hypothetical protein
MFSQDLHLSIALNMNQQMVKLFQLVIKLTINYYPIRAIFSSRDKHSVHLMVTGNSQFFVCIFKAFASEEVVGTR